MTYSWQGDIKILPTGSVMAKWVKMGSLIVLREVKKVCLTKNCAEMLSLDMEFHLIWLHLKLSSNSCF